MVSVGELKKEERKKLVDSQSVLNCILRDGIGLTASFRIENIQRKGAKPGHLILSQLHDNESRMDSIHERSCGTSFLTTPRTKCISILKY